MAFISISRASVFRAIAVFLFALAIIPLGRKLNRWQGSTEAEIVGLKQSVQLLTQKYDLLRLSHQVQEAVLEQQKAAIKEMQSENKLRKAMHTVMRQQMQVS